MKIRYIFAVVLIAAALMALTGCSGNKQDIDGMYIVTFELNGGTLDIKSSKVSDKINYAYNPGSMLLDPSDFNGNVLDRTGHEFTGWYKSPECLEGDLWDFKTDTITSEKMTLYAGWKLKKNYSFSVCYNENGTDTVLGKYENVNAGTTFGDYRNYAEQRTGYTRLGGFYADSECLIPWNDSTVHPGGETDTDVRVYVKYIEGTWNLVADFAQLHDAIGKGNIYLLADIDCGGADISFGSEFNAVLEGNGHTIKNFTIRNSTMLRPMLGIFRKLGAEADIRNIKFDNVLFTTGELDLKMLQFSALANEAAQGCKISNVGITGQLDTLYAGELPRMQAAFYNETSDTVAVVSDFSATITRISK